MTPNLPPNPMTITPPMKMVLTADGVIAKYTGRMLTKELFAGVRADLQVLRDWDNYERAQSKPREDAKRVLRRILDQEL